MTRKHPTSSVFVFRRARRGWQLGLIEHPRFGRLMIPGGHVEPDESPAEAALREVAEETGLAIRLVGPPAPPVPDGYRLSPIAPPWWMVEYQVPRDNHLGEAHVHIDHLYVALAGGPRPGAAPAHPFGWYTAADLPGLHMFDDARTMALALLAGLSGLAAPSGLPGPAADGAAPGGAGVRAALLASLGGPPGDP